MARRKVARNLVIAGAVAGACVSVAITFGMDYFMAGALGQDLGGTWTDAVAKDLNSCFSTSYTNTSPVVYVVFALIVLILGAFGAAMGAVFALFFIKFLDLLVKQ